jgi:hypothetical protein
MARRDNILNLVKKKIKERGHLEGAGVERKIILN